MTDIEFDAVTVVYRDGVLALDALHLRVERGAFVAIVGPSGAGKSTLLKTVNHLVAPTRGEVRIAGRSVTRARAGELRALRARTGMIFQTFDLVKRTSALHNVLNGRLGAMSALRGALGAFSRDDVALAHDCLRRVGIAEKAFARADTLSGGQQQRVGIARALAQRPAVMLADEPVASLDPPTAHAVLRDLRRLAREDGITTLVNLHDVDHARAHADRIVGLRAGRVVFDGTPAEATDEVFAAIYARPERERLDPH